MAIVLKRVYDKVETDDGYRVLVDRLWPRGLSRERLQADRWIRELAPEASLRKSFHGGELTWEQFRSAYMEQLDARREALEPLAQLASKRTVTLLFSARDTDHNNAVVLRDYLVSMTGR